MSAPGHGRKEGHFANPGKRCIEGGQFLIKRHAQAGKVGEGQFVTLFPVNSAIRSRTVAAVVFSLSRGKPMRSRTQAK
jgi:hypothetical protein